MHADRAMLIRVVTKSTVVIEGSYDASGSSAEAARSRRVLAPAFRQLISQQGPVIERLRPEELPSPFREQLADMRHLGTIPLVEGGRVFATIAVSRRRDQPFRPQDLVTLTPLGRVAVMALWNAVPFDVVEALTKGLRSSEERFRHLVDGVKDYAIFMLDNGGHVTSWNQGAERIKGYRTDEILGHHFSAFYTLQDAADGKPARALGIAEREGRYEEEGWRRRKDGSHFLASVTITALRDEIGHLQGFAKVTRDITEKRRLQDQLLESERREASRFRQVAERLEALEQMKAQFLNLASHELRTPVSLISGYLSLFEEGDLGQLNDYGRQALSVLRAQALQLERLTGQLLEAAALQSDAVSLRQDVIDLREPVLAAISQVRDGAGRDHHIEVSTPERPVRVRADRERFGSVLRNLLDNAAKYSPQGGLIRCEVAIGRRWARVRVTDRGLGITAEQREQLFGRFGRVVDGQTAAIRGAGLGLYLARELARLHGGGVSVESTDPGATTFVLKMPIEPSSGLTEPDPASPV